MKRMFCLMVGMLCFFTLTTQAQIFFKQTFDGVTAPALPAGWSATGSATANWATANLLSSSPIPPYSGTNNIVVQDCGPNNQTRRIQTPSFSTVGRTNIVLSYGIRRSASFPSGAIVEEYSINGGTVWTAFAIGSAGSTTWSTVFATLPVAVENQASVIIRWSFTTTIGSGCSGSENFRIDDVTVAQSIILPILLTKFNAGYDKNKVKLRWETSHEIDFSHFEIERSVDGKNFVTIGTVQSNGGTSNSVANYEYADDITAENPTLFYRIKLVDLNGTLKYSSIAKLKINSKGVSINSLYPVPAVNEININWNSNTTGSTRFKITDIAGRTVYAQTSLTQKGNNLNKINISKLNSGTYYLIIETDTDKLVEKFMKQ